MWVKAGVCPAANWTIRLNLHGIQQVLVTETGRPADLNLSCPDPAGTRVVELEKERGGSKNRAVRVFTLFCLISRSHVPETIMRLS